MREPLGRGAFGEVWVAKDSRLKRKVAIKLPLFDSSDEKKIRRFIAEAKAAAALRHPNIVPIFDAGFIGKQPYIASEMIRGVPLSGVNDGNSVPPAWAAKIVGKIANALHYAHKQNIIHRDIKPDNVLVDRRGDPQILDFGLAKRLDADASHTIDGTVLGTPAYMSPEQARGAVAEMGPASDQYSIGVVLYRLLAGRTPFQGPPMAILQQVISGTPPKLTEFAPDLAADLVAICAKARADSPTDRYQDCGELANDLQRFCDGHPVQARMPGPIGLALRWSQKNRRETALAATFVLVSSVALITTISGWVSASRVTTMAAQAESQVRKETERLVAIETKLEQRVDEAEAARDLARQAQEAEAAIRTQVEEDTLRLAEATDAANAAIARMSKSQSALTKNKSAVSLMKAELEQLSAFPEKPDGKSNSEPSFAIADSQGIKTSTAPAVPPKATQTHDSASSPDVSPSSNSRSFSQADKLFSCKWKGEQRTFRFARRIRLETIGSSRHQILRRKILPKDISVLANGNFVLSWGNGMTTQMGYGHLPLTGGNVDSIVSFTNEKRAASAAARRTQMEAGKLWFYTGKTAVSASNEVFVALGNCNPNAILKMASEQPIKMKVIRTIKSNLDIDIYHKWAPGWIYNISRESISRIRDQESELVFELEKKTPRTIIAEAEYLSESLLIIKIREGKKTRDLLLDASTNEFFAFREPFQSTFAAAHDGMIYTCDREKIYLNRIVEY